VERKKKGIRIATIIITVLILAGAVGIYLSLGESGQTAGGGSAAGQTARTGGGNPAATGGPPSEGGPPGSGRPAEGASGRSSGTGARTAVQVESIATGMVGTYIVTNGEVLAGMEVEVFSDVSGKIVNSPVNEGDFVGEGQAIAMVDPSRPGESYSASPVYAPVSGTLTSVPLSRGDTVGTQSPVAVISDLSNLKVSIYVPERYVGQLKRGLPAVASFEAFPEKKFETVVSRLSPVLDQASRTLRVELDFVRRNPEIKVGMFAGVQLITEQRQDVLLAPREAVLSSTGDYVVYVVNGMNGQGIAERRTVQLGLQGKEKVEILSGLELGESVVVKGQNFLSDGDPVRIIPQEES